MPVSLPYAVIVSSVLDRSSCLNTNSLIDWILQAVHDVSLPLLDRHGRGVLWARLKPHISRILYGVRDNFCLLATAATKNFFIDARIQAPAQDLEILVTSRAFIGSFSGRSVSEGLQETSPVCTGFFSLSTAIKRLTFHLYMGSFLSSAPLTTMRTRE